ncbi:hypothetical protein J7I98_38150 [Streptomyces sp. ISL-98]|uniref:hypothetical protein n=1 Tax=Streptomyces sp. ISL-98 TaxID=2819192 RepID=UPI001BE5B4DD|nr:hypothetical protein [Streptomyces sp. ISL-98]MBT2511518.1 hypothetical protein [Streptomyces sp. ISL-98]
MRAITGTDIIDFYNSRYDLLVLTADGEFDYQDHSGIDTSSYDDGRATAYDFVTTDDGSQVQVLLERATVVDGEWFPDALEDGALIPAVADEMAAIITNDGILPSRARKAIDASAAWRKAVEEADSLAMQRALAVAEVVAYAGGNQSEAGRRLGLDQSTVNKLVKKAAR